MADNFGKTKFPGERESISLRGRIVGMHDAGKSNSEISQHSGCHPITIRRWIRTFDEEGDLSTRMRSGRPRVTPDEQDRAIVEMSMQNPRINSIDIKRNLASFKEKDELLKDASIWIYKNVSGATKIETKLQKQLASDILCLFEESQFVDLKLELPHGCVYSHKVIISCRFPLFWKFLRDISHFQVRKITGGICTVFLPTINIEEFKGFIRSLYTNEVDNCTWLSIQRSLKRFLFTLKRRYYKDQTLFLEKLNSDEELELENSLLHQLKKGEISEAKGNLRDITHLVSSKLKCPSVNLHQPSKNSSKNLGHHSKAASALVSPHYSLPFFQNFSCKRKKLSSRCDVSHNPLTFSTAMSTENLESTSQSLDTEKLNTEKLNKCISSPFNRDHNKIHSSPLTDCDDKAAFQEMELPHLAQAESDKDGLSKNFTHLNKSSISGCFSELDLEGKQREGLQNSKTFSGFLSSPCQAKQLNMSFTEKYSNSDNGIQTEHNNAIASNFLAKEVNLEPTKQGHFESQMDKDSSILHQENNESQKLDLNPKPLVRTKTFSLSENSFLLNECDEKEMGNVHKEINSNLDESSSYESNIAFQSKDVSWQEDPLKMREIERKKGSLIFEHNFQTFSNIPPTNMMSISLGSDNSMQLISLYNKMKENVGMNSIQPSSMDEKHLGQAHTFKSLYEKEPITTLRLPINSMTQSSQGGLSKNIADTRTPSPDSLCIDQPNEAKNFTKEELAIEEKEKDDQEASTTLKLSIGSQVNKADTSLHNNTLALSCDVNSTNNGSVPRLNHIDNCKPIASGGSILHQKESLKEENYPKHTQRQIGSGSIRDFDDIPLVSGYISPAKEKEPVENLKKAHEQPQQSMFSMFIDLDQISPEQKDPPNPLKAKPPASGGMYMFIEADDLSSPKAKRRNKLETRSQRRSVSSTQMPVEFDVGEAPKLVDTPESTEAVPEMKEEATKETLKEETRNLNKGFFTFIDAEYSSKENSPKPKRRTPIHRRVSKPPANVMSKSAPSDCLLFSREDSSKTSSSTESSSKLMTKSVIDREEFMAQPPTRRNVSLSDKINESSRIPRPITNLKKLSLESPKNAPLISRTSKISYTKKKEQTKNLSRLDEIQSLASEAPTGLTADADDTSDISDISSLLSSIDRSNEFSDKDRQDSNNALGNDLLKMFLDEINTDVTVQIGERKIRAHKCILASRCAYFAAMLSGHWVESAGNVIKLQGFSPDTVLVALKHIYSGNSAVPVGMDVKELAALADMLALDGLKDVVALHLKAEACHYFHKPCPECLNGVLEVLPIASSFCLEELYHKCLKWVAKHFPSVISTRVFSALPPDLQERCLKQIIDDMSINNVIDAVLGGDQIISSLPVVRWAQPIFDLMAHLLETATNFIATNMSRVLASDRFESLRHDDGQLIDNLEDTFKVSCDLIRPDEAVLAHIHLTNLTESIASDDQSGASENFVGLVSRLLRQVEKFIIHNANRVAVCRKWPLFPPETQKRIKDAALVVFEFSKPTLSRLKFSSTPTVRRRGNSTDPALRPRTNSLSDQHRLSRSASTSVVPPRGVPVTDTTPTRRLQVIPGRCHTPPAAPVGRVLSVQTPPPTRASTLRAQARQAAIQRSQSARTVIERPNRLKSGHSDVSTENDSSSNSAPTRGSGFARSPRSRTSSQSSSFSTFSGASRASTPGIVERTKHKRNASVPHLVAVNGNFQSDGENVPRKAISGQRSSERPHDRSGSKCVFRLQTPDLPVRPLQLQSSSMSSLRDREFSPRGQKKNLPVVKPAKARPVIGSRLRSPLRENNRANIPSTRSLARVASGTTKEWSDESVKKVETVGLGTRSNTFCKDDRPPPPASEGDDA